MGYVDSDFRRELDQITRRIDEVTSEEVEVAEGLAERKRRDGGNVVSFRNNVVGLPITNDNEARREIEIRELEKQESNEREVLERLRDLQEKRKALEAQREEVERQILKGMGPGYSRKYSDTHTMIERQNEIRARKSKFG